MARTLAWIVAKIVIFVLATVGAIILSLLSALVVQMVGTLALGATEDEMTAIAYALPVPGVAATLVTFALFEFVYRPLAGSRPGMISIAAMVLAPGVAVIVAVSLIVGNGWWVGFGGPALALVCVTAIAAFLLAVRVMAEDRLFF